MPKAARAAESLASPRRLDARRRRTCAPAGMRASGLVTTKPSTSISPLATRRSGSSPGSCSATRSPSRRRRRVTAFGELAMLGAGRSAASARPSARDLVGQEGDEVRNAPLLGPSAAGVAESDHVVAALDVALAHDDHVRHLAQLGVADARLHPLPRVVADRGAEVSRQETLDHAVSAVHDRLDIVLHRHDLDLDGRQPERELSREVLDEHPEEALERAVDGAVDHHRRAGLPGGVDVLAAEAPGELEVQLDGPRLPGTPDGVLHQDVDLGPVERALAGVHGESARTRAALQDPEQRRLRPVPGFDVADEVLGPRAQSEGVVEAEDAVEVVGDLEDAVVLRFDLLFGHEDVGVVLLELADTQKSVQGPRSLEAMERVQLQVAQGELAVAVPAQVVDDVGVGAVHGLDAIGGLFVDRNDEHVLPVVVPVARRLPQPLVIDERRDDLLVAAGTVLAA